MIKQAPSRGRMVVMVAFAFSCFVLLLYLWRSFGGPTPIAPQGYRLEVDFSEATVLADNADVRVSGVSVGQVIDSVLRDDSTRATIEIDSKYAPVARDTRATLRQKTLLGETYVELSPGDREAGSLPDGEVLPEGQVRDTVELDEILRNFDSATRRDLKRFVTGLAGAVDGRGEDLSSALASLPSFAHDSGDALRSLDVQRDALRTLVRDTGTVFATLGRRQGELSGLVRAADRVFTTTARRNRELAETVRILPTTLAELRPTFREVRSFSREAAPVVRALRPAGRALGGALTDAAALAPELRGLFLDVDEVTRASRTAVPAATDTVRSARPLFPLLADTLREALPVVDYAGLMRHEVVAMVANLAAATQGSDVAPSGERVHYLRALVPVNSEAVVGTSFRFGTNRHNPYLGPRALDKLPSGLEAIDCANTGNLSPQVVPPAPACKLQQPFEFRGRRTAYPQLRRDP